MRKYITKTEDTCWRDCIGCMMNINPMRVPNFVKLYDDNYVEKTREWLYKKYKKGIVYVPTREFMEGGDILYNSKGGPKGYSIGHLSMVRGENGHVVICKDGLIYWDNGEDRHEEYEVMRGYFIIYNL